MLPYVVAALREFTRITQLRSAQRPAAADLMKTALAIHSSNPPGNSCQKHFATITIWYYYPTRRLWSR